MAKVITYNSGLNRIYAEGGTEGDPITFADLYAADQGGGWGVVHYFGQNTYHLDALLYLGDNTTPTYFIDIEKLVVFTDVIGGNTIDLIYVYNNAHIQLGELVDEAKKEVSKGCAIVSRFNGVSSYFFRGGSTNTYRRLYGCTVISPNEYNKKLLITVRDAGRLWHCQFANYVWPYILGDADIYRCTVLSGTDVIRAYGIDAQMGSPTIDDYVGLHLRRLANCYPSNYDIKLSRVKAINNEQAVAIQGTHNKDAILLDCELTNWLMYMRGVTQLGKVLRKYSVNINISDKDGASLSGVNIVCKDKNNNEVFSVNTDVNGNIEEQEVTYQEWYQLATGWHGEEDATCYSPHKFLISKTGKETLEIDDITLSEPVKWHLELQDEVVSGFVLAGQNLEGQLEPKINLTGNLQKNVNMIGVLEETDILVGVLQKKTVMTGKLRKTDLVGEMK